MMRLLSALGDFLAAGYRLILRGPERGTTDR